MFIYAAASRRIVLIWMLATAKGLLAPTEDQTVMIKGQAEVVLEDGRIARFIFWPLNPEAIATLRRATKKS